MRLRALREGVEQSGASSEAGRVSRGAALAAAPGASPGAAAPCAVRSAVPMRMGAPYVAHAMPMRAAAGVVPASHKPVTCGLS